MKSANNWPKANYHAMTQFFGPVGENQALMRVPYPLTLAWDQSKQVTRIRCNRRVVNSLDKIFNTVLDLYGFQGIQELHLDQWGGCFNVRKMRGGSQYSMHSWGAAHDWYPQSNGLRTPWTMAKFSDPVYCDFFNAWIYEGWEPLGLSIGRDAMHFQATDNNVMPLPTHLEIQKHYA